MCVVREKDLSRDGGWSRLPPNINGHTLDGKYQRKWPWPARCSGRIFLAPPWQSETPTHSADTPEELWVTFESAPYDYYGNDDGCGNGRRHVGHFLEFPAWAPVMESAISKDNYDALMHDLKMYRAEIANVEPRGFWGTLLGSCRVMKPNSVLVSEYELGLKTIIKRHSKSLGAMTLAGGWAPVNWQQQTRRGHSSLGFENLEEQPIVTDQFGRILQSPMIVEQREFILKPTSEEDSTVRIFSDFETKPVWPPGAGYSIIIQVPAEKAAEVRAAWPTTETPNEVPHPAGPAAQIHNTIVTVQAEEPYAQPSFLKPDGARRDPCRLLIACLLVTGIIAGLVYWIYVPVDWMTRGRFEVTKGWKNSTCTVVQQRCERYCSCCAPDQCSETPDFMFLSDDCHWLDSEKYMRVNTTGLVVRGDFKGRGPTKSESGASRRNGLLLSLSSRPDARDTGEHDVEYEYGYDGYDYYGYDYDAYERDTGIRRYGGGDDCSCSAGYRILLSLQVVDQKMMEIEETCTPNAVGNYGICFRGELFANGARYSKGHRPVVG
jgi:hypothetical protein